MTEQEREELVMRMTQDDGPERSDAQIRQIKQQAELELQQILRQKRLDDINAWNRLLDQMRVPTLLAVIGMPALVLMTLVLMLT